MSQQEKTCKNLSSPASSSPRCVLNGRQRFFSHICDEDWQSWRWQLRHRLSTLEELARFKQLSEVELERLPEVLQRFRLGITPYFLSLIDPDDPHDPLARQAMPSLQELLTTGDESADPLAEVPCSPVPGLTHRYPDRVLMVVSSTCAVYCRHCLRKRIMSQDEQPRREIDAMIQYLAATPTVREVLVSGGDPFALATSQLEEILTKLRAIPHLEIIRIGSRMPATLPQRIDDELCTMLQRFHPLWVNVQFNHPRECTAEAALACDRLLRAGIPLNNQSVLLRGVNDDLAVMKELVHALLRLRVRPYYLFQCDPVQGTAHLRTTVATGQQIISGLRGHTSGLAVPIYAIDAPGGGGKILAEPSPIISYDQATGRVLFHNYQGLLYQYQDPPE
jgi:lysine 2,3-aminomutase